MANQLTKDKKTIALIESWENNPSKIQRHIFWYYQTRLRWVGQTPPDNTEDLLSSIEKKITKEEPEVQWAMNFTAAQIGVFDSEQRSRCIVLGENLGLYKDDLVPKGCTPSYLPEFIKIQVDKFKK
jgi:3-methyladenine DNA glycosylase AlkD